MIPTITAGVQWEGRPSQNKVCKSLKGLDSNKKNHQALQAFPHTSCAWQMTADQVSYIFYLSLQTGAIPQVCNTAFVIPLLKGSDPVVLNHYWHISKLFILAKVLERSVNDQLKDYLFIKHFILSSVWFYKKHSAVAPITKLMNDIVETLDDKQYCSMKLQSCTLIFSLTCPRLLTL